MPTLDQIDTVLARAHRELVLGRDVDARASLLEARGVIATLRRREAMNARATIRLVPEVAHG